MGGKYVRDGGRRSETLNDAMDIDHVVIVHEDGTVSTDTVNVWAPEVIAKVDDDGNFTPTTERDLAASLKEAGWTAASGWSGQQGTRGDDIVMHESEFIGGSLAEHILATPGYWVVCVVTCDRGEGDDNVAGRVVLHQER